MARRDWAWLGGLLALVALGCTRTGEGGGSGGGLGTTGGAPGGGQSSGGSSAGTGGAVADPTGGSGGSSEPIPSAGVSTVAEFCAVFPAAMAAYKAGCEGGSVDDWLRFSPDCGAAVRSETLGRVSLNVEQADLCLHGLAGDECKGFSCSQVLAGTIPENGSCNHLDTWVGDECEPGFDCEGSACNAVCSPPDLLSEGGNCGGMFNNAICPAPLQCDAEAICAVPRGEGEPCRGVWDCRPELYCQVVDGSDPSLGGTCQPRTAGDGVPCEADECAPGYHCRGAEGAMACALPKHVGDSCVFGWHECSQQCSLEGVCEVSSHEGDPCGLVEDPATGESENLQCSTDLFCETESSTCQKRIETGASCVDVLSLGDPCAPSAEGVVECGMGACQLCEWVLD